MFPGDHPLSMGCISCLGMVQDIFLESDLLISFGARLTEFDTGRFGLKLPPKHIQVVEDSHYAGDRIPSTLVVGNLAAITQSFGPGRFLHALRGAISLKSNPKKPNAWKLWRRKVMQRSNCFALSCIAMMCWQMINPF